MFVGGDRVVWLMVWLKRGLQKWETVLSDGLKRAGLFCWCGFALRSNARVDEFEIGPLSNSPKLLLSSSARTEGLPLREAETALYLGWRTEPTHPPSLTTF